jgi:AcrR family transcriptional regulator
MARVRLQPKARRATILIAAIRLARRPGQYVKLTRAKIAKEAQCTEGLVSHYLGEMDNIRSVIMREAIKHEYLDLIAQGIAANDKNTRGISPLLKHRALSTL